MAGDVSAMERARKFFESWVYHRNNINKTWNKYWIVLRGTSVFIFVSNKTISDNLLGTISLDSGTKVADLPSKKSFKIKISNISANGCVKHNIFKFAKENERNYFKSLVCGISNGEVGNDTPLHADQLSDVIEAVVEANRLRSFHGSSRLSTNNASSDIVLNTTKKPLQTTTPSQPMYCNLPSESFVESNAQSVTPSQPMYCNLPSESFVESNAQSVTPSQPMYCNFPDIPPVERDIASSSRNATHRNSDITEAKVPDEVTSSEADQTLRELQKRQSDLAQRELTFEDLLGSPSPISSSGFDSVASVWKNSSSHHSDDLSTSRPEYFNLSSASSVESTEKRASKDTHSINNNNKVHPFYSNSEHDTLPPKWFINDCSRTEAEQILTIAKRLGNVLMRTSSSFPVSGKYVISMCFERPVRISHYSVIRNERGFKIDVRNKHDEMQTLSDVMNFFLSVAGSSARSIQSNDRSELYGERSLTDFDSISLCSSIPPSPPPSPPQPSNWRTPTTNFNN